VKKSLLQPSSHSREDNTNNDCTRALVSEYHYDVQRGRCPALDTGYTSHLDLKASIDKRGALAMDPKRKWRAKDLPRKQKTADRSSDG
jgi:hypothetical protein